MAFTSSDIDAIFEGAGAVVDATQNIMGAVSNGVKQVQNTFDNSRRNAAPSTGGNNGYAAYYQPSNYGYGYAEPTGYPQQYGIMPQLGTSTCSVPQFFPNMGTNPYQPYIPTFNGLGQMTQPNMYNVGYYGFSDPGYGSGGFNNGGNNPGGRGGSFGWG